MFNPYFTGAPRNPSRHARSSTPDRQEIIRKIKSRPDVTQPTPDHTINHDAAQPVVSLGDIGLDGPLPDSRGHLGLAIVGPRSSQHKDNAKQLVSNLLLDSNPIPAPLPHATGTLESPHKSWQIDAVQTFGRASPQTIRAPAIPQHTAPSAFSYQSPTSPLVNLANVDDMSDEVTDSPGKPIETHVEFKRHVSAPLPLPAQQHERPRIFHGSPTSMNAKTPYMAHQPRRSVGSVDFASLRQAYNRARRSSVSGASPLQSSMVGSFEESILLGRMSSTPSLPLDFTAQIGVLGIGDCKPHLRCPAHIAVPFPAVFYTYGLAASQATSDRPSPYVGMIDLDAREVDPQNQRRIRRKTSATEYSSQPVTSSPVSAGHLATSDLNIHRSLCPPQGAYRIPPRGQLQVVIKNPQKTAVKLFLVPYDVSDIRPGQKTFIRQRSSLAQDGPTTATTSSNTTSATSSSPNAVIRSDRSVLRYLIQLHICCTSKDRIYLYKNIRVVFADRTPDSKEKLHSEIQYPEPRFSIYKPIDSPTDPAAEHIRLQNRRLSDVVWSKSAGLRGLDSRPHVVTDAAIPTEAITDSPPAPTTWSPVLRFAKRKVGPSWSPPVDTLAEIDSDEPLSPLFTSASTAVTRNLSSQSLIADQLRALNEKNDE